MGIAIAPFPYKKTVTINKITKELKVKSYTSCNATDCNKISVKKHSEKLTPDQYERIIKSQDEDENLCLLLEQIDVEFAVYGCSKWQRVTIREKLQGLNW